MTIFARDALAGRRALVTGASGGLGKHFATTLAAHGAHVIAAARRASALDEVVAAIAATGGSASAVALDVRDTASVEAAIATSGPLDIVVNNAGIALTRPVLETDDAAWHEVIDTNLTGAFRVARAAARAMGEEDRGGVIVNIASILAFRVAKQVAAYTAAKAALVQLTQALALELASKRIRVNALAPGYIVTDLNREFLASPAGEAMVKRVPMRRFGAAQDLDGALLLLASDAGRYMTGTTIVVDGGHGIAWL
jgi:NAD(P)-dependent dehydrogenase (short-subunit alcohol dehydrogenase family)